MTELKKVDFTTVTEITGNNVTSEQIQRMYTRYRFASEFCKDKGNYSGRHKGTEHQRHKVERSEENELLNFP